MCICQEGQKAKRSPRVRQEARHEDSAAEAGGPITTNRAPTNRTMYTAYFKATPLLPPSSFQLFPLPPSVPATQLLSPKTFALMFIPLRRLPPRPLSGPLHSSIHVSSHTWPCSLDLTFHHKAGLNSWILCWEPSSTWQEFCLLVLSPAPERVPGTVRMFRVVCWMDRWPRARSKTQVSIPSRAK